jgi:uncharacterized protein YxjI
MDTVLGGNGTAVLDYPAPNAARPDSPLDLTQFVVKEHVGLLKLSDTYDIFDAVSQEKVALARENISPFIKVLRLFVNKQLLPTRVTVTQDHEQGPLLFEIKRPITFLRSTVSVFDAAGTRLGYFKSKLFSLGGGFYVYDVKDQCLAEVKGDWKGWNFRFLDPTGNELGTVSKKWAGLAKELFTSADTYMVKLEDNLRGERTATILLLAAALAIDVVFKENRG